jgi:hypothetical protein
VALTQCTLSAYPASARLSTTATAAVRSKLTDLARQPDAEALLAEVRARKAATAPALPPDRILAHQLEDRR